VAEEEFKSVDDWIEVDDANSLIQNLDYLKVFNTPLIQHPLLTLSDQADHDFEHFSKVMVDPNYLILWKRMKLIEKFEPNWKYKNAYINMERIKCILFQINPWFRSRMGHEMWWYANYSNPDSYYVLGWEDHYGPKHWYKPGEPMPVRENPKPEESTPTKKVSKSNPKGRRRSANR